MTCPQCLQGKLIPVIPRDVYGKLLVDETVYICTECPAEERIFDFRAIQYAYIKFAESCLGREITGDVLEDVK